MLTLFFIQGAVGCLIALLLIPVRAAGRSFFRYAAAQTAALLILGVAAGSRSAGVFVGAGWVPLSALALLVAAAGFFHLGRLEIGRWLMIATLIPAVVVVVRDTIALIPGGDPFVLSTLLYLVDAFTSGLTTGAALVAMMLGHAYLNIPGLPIRYLERLSLFLLMALVLRAVVTAIGVTLGWAGIAPLFQVLLDPAAMPASGTGLDPFVLVALMVHVLCGLAAPLAFATMAWRSAKINATQSATGILYVALVVVTMGEMASRYLLTLTRMPL